MISGRVKITNSIGIHLRPAGDIANAALQYKCHVQLRYGERSADGKSLLSILGLGIKYGHIIEIVCDGEDEEAAFQAVEKVIQKCNVEKY